MRGNVSRRPDKQETVKLAKARLVAILYGCTPKALEGFTPEQLAATHRVPLKECEYALIVARQKRAALNCGKCGTAITFGDATTYSGWCMPCRVQPVISMETERTGS